MEKQSFRSGDVAPVSGNYQFLNHQSENPECIPRLRAYVHLRKGMKIPLHDQCEQPAVYRLLTVTDEDRDPKMLGV